MDAADVLLKRWEDERAAGRQSEEQRAKLTNMLLVISAAGLGFVSQQGLSRSTLIVTISLTFVGLYGALASEKLYERFRWHDNQSRAISEELEAFVPGLDVKETFARGRNRHRGIYKYIGRVRLHWIWTSLHLATAATGLLLTAIIEFS